MGEDIKRGNLQALHNHPPIINMLTNRWLVLPGLISVDALVYKLLQTAQRN